MLPRLTLTIWGFWIGTSSRKWFRSVQGWRHARSPALSECEIPDWLLWLWSIFQEKSGDRTVLFCSPHSLTLAARIRWGGILKSKAFSAKFNSLSEMEHWICSGRTLQSFSIQYLLLHSEIILKKSQRRFSSSDCPDSQLDHPGQHQHFWRKRVITINSVVHQQMQTQCTI